MTTLGLRLPAPPARPYAAADPFVQRALGRRYRAIGALVAASVVAAAGVAVLLGRKEPAAVVGAHPSVATWSSKPKDRSRLGPSSPHRTGTPCRRRPFGGPAETTSCSPSSPARRTPALPVR